MTERNRKITRNGTLSGLGSLLKISPEMTIGSRLEKGSFRADQAALSGDWKVVGEEIQKAYHRIKK